MTEGAAFGRPDAGSDTRAPRVFWPLLPIGLSVFLLAALTAFRLRGGVEGESGLLAAPVVAFYQLLGFEPAFMFCLLLLTWSSIWFLGGQAERPGQRVLRVVGLTLCLAILVNLRSDGTVPEHGGAIGGFLASRLYAVFGFIASTLVVSLAAIVMLFRATDSFFIRQFEGAALRPEPASDPLEEDGVEPQAIDELQALQLESAPRVARGGVRVLAHDETADPAPALPPGQDLGPDSPDELDDAESWPDESAFDPPVLGAPVPAPALPADVTASEPGDELLAEAASPDEVDLPDEVELPDEFEEFLDDRHEHDDRLEDREDREEREEREELLETQPEPVVELPAAPPVEPPPPPGGRQGALFGAPVADENLLNEAAELVVEYRRASANFLRRRLRITLEEAKDVLAALAARGIIECEPGAGHGRVVVDRV